jgi:hypothetical protein
MAGVLWIIWVKIGSSLTFYFVAIDDDWRFESPIRDCRSTKNECRYLYSPGRRVPQRVIIQMKLGSDTSELFRLAPSH